MACPICDLTAKKGKRPTSMAYVVETDDDGMGIAAAREEHVEALEAAGMPLEWVEDPDAAGAPESASDEPEPEATSESSDDAEYEEVDEEPAPEPVKPKPARKERKATAKPAPEPEPAEEDQDEEPAEEPEPKARKSTRGRPTVGLTIMVGATFLRGLPGGRTVITSAEALDRFGAELAEDMGASSYWELDSFKRRERIAQKADYIASQLARHVLVHPMNLSPHDDASALVNALMGLTEGIDAVISRVG